MKQNKGFIGIGLILAIVLGVAVIGGGAYYLGKNGSKPVVINPENILPNNENKELPVVENKKSIEEKTAVKAGCTSNSPSAINLISPNGGETYTAGQKITVKWESCNVTPNSIAFTLFKHDISKPYQQSEMYRTALLGGSDPYVLEADDGISEFTLPNYTSTNSDPSSNLTLGQMYFIGISGDGDATNIGSGYIPGDYSDGLFTINSPKVVVKTDPFNRYVSSDCKISSGCNGPIHCVDKSAEDNMATTCESLPEYACYQINSIRCEKQTSGKCGWTNSAEFNSCVSKARSS